MQLVEVRANVKSWVWCALIVSMLAYSQSPERKELLTSDLTNSGSRRSLAAQKAISSVITPLRA